MSNKKYKQTELNLFFKAEGNQRKTLKRKHSPEIEEMSGKGSKVHDSGESKRPEVNSAANAQPQNNDAIEKACNQHSKGDSTCSLTGETKTDRNSSNKKTEVDETSEANNDDSYSKKKDKNSSENNGVSSEADNNIVKTTNDNEKSLKEDDISINLSKKDENSLNVENDSSGSKNEHGGSSKGYDDNFNTIAKNVSKADSDTNTTNEKSYLQSSSSSKSTPVVQERTDDKRNASKDDKQYCQEQMQRKSDSVNPKDIEDGVNSKGAYLKPLEPSENHIVLFDCQESWEPTSIPKPYPSNLNPSENRYRPDSSQVIMPYFFNPEYKHNKYEKSSSQSRWERIQCALKKNIAGVFELESAIKSYNVHFKHRWNFDTLYDFFENLDQHEKDIFFQKTLPEMCNLALRLSDICTKPLPILKQNKSMKVTMSQQQAASLLANAFFCTFPTRNVNTKSVSLPDINFNNLYSGGPGKERKIEKLKCLLNYFERVTKKMPTGTLTFSRQYERDNPDWKSLENKFTNMTVDAEGSIEDVGTEMLQADFANKLVGGGVLGRGLVQEEIRFIICPEMIVSRLFTETLLDNEVLIMTGCERFCKYTGYSDTFKFAGNYIDQTSWDSWGRRMIDVVAMDALVVRGNPRDQFKLYPLKRELNKAYCAFHDDYRNSELYQNAGYHPSPVCTGNWGCGAFKGDKHLKAVIQMMAASYAGREIYYCTFGDAEFTRDLQLLHIMLRKYNIKISKMMMWISEYEESHSRQTLFEFIFKKTGRHVTKSTDSQSTTNSGDEN
nr:poly(ADP-ribose) glycohydrolase-like [Biomphalaria glabrata]